MTTSENTELRLCNVSSVLMTTSENTELRLCNVPSVLMTTSENTEQTVQCVLGLNDYI